MDRWPFGATRLVLYLNQRECSFHERVCRMATKDRRPCASWLFTGTEKYSVVSGPSREDLFDSLRLRFDQGKVAFCWLGRDNQRVLGDVSVTAIHSCGDGELGADWFVKGDCHLRKGSTSIYVVTISYNTRTRKGIIWLP